MSIKKLAVTLFISTLLLTVSCEFLDLLIEDPENPPTRSRMLGTWQLVEAYTEDGDTIPNNLCFPITAFHFKNDDNLASTAGPMTTHIVYGPGRYANVASIIDQFFDYASFSPTAGDWFIGGGDTDRFTLEMRLRGLPGQGAFTDLLGLLGIGNDHLHMVIYHKFFDVRVTFHPQNDRIMYWDIDHLTTAQYNSRDHRGEPVLWRGVSAENFSRGTFVFEKRSYDLEELVKRALE